MRYLLGLMACVIATGCTQSPHQTLLRDAHRLAQCTLEGDAACVIGLSSIVSYERISPPHADFKAAQSRFFSQLSRAGARYARFDVGGAGEIYRSANSPQYAFVPYTSTLQVPGQALKATTAYLIGISDDDGKSWRFFDGVHVSADNIRQVLPSYRGQPLPPVKSE
jgi:hypothetical protein